jgi:hypothetical protein
MPYHPIVAIDDGLPADPALGKKRRQQLRRCVSGSTVTTSVRHHVHRAHRHILRRIPGRMDEDQLFLRLAKPPPAGISEDEYRHADDLAFIKAQLAQVPTRREIWQAAMLGMLGGAVAAVTLIEAFARACN